MHQVLETAGTCVDIVNGVYTPHSNAAALTSRTTCIATSTLCGTDGDSACGWLEDLTGKEDFYLKITNNNGTVHSYQDLSVQITLNEVQMIIFGTNGQFHCYW